MGHGKETPRQKMIGLMYLFLTCMLALNVSKDVLNAFMIVNEGLNETTENFGKKNEMIYGLLDKAAAENAAKAGPWNAKAIEVKKRTEVLVKQLQYYKDTIAKTADGIDTAVNKLAKGYENRVQSKDNTDFAAQIMYGQENNGEGKKLRAQIEEYRKFMLSLVPEKNKTLRATIEQNLDTSDPPPHEGQNVSWESHNFEHLPLIAVLTIMSQMQAAIRNTESDVITYLNEQIDAASFKFNTLLPTVIPNSNYIMSGGKYRAEVFLAAFDSTQVPLVYEGKVDSSKNADGTYNYFIRGNKTLLDLDKKTKKRIYEVGTSGQGERKWEGIIAVKKPTGDTLTFPFRQSYLVAQAALVVSPTKMNVFYIGVENPVDISVPGVPSSQLMPSISGGSISKGTKEGSYIVKVQKPGTTDISVSAKLDGGTKPMGKQTFRVKRVPDPVAKLGGQKSGGIDLSMLQAAKRVDAVLENFDFDLVFTISEFTVSTTDRAGYQVEKSVKGGNINSEIRSSVYPLLKKGSKVIFEGIKAKGPDGSERELSPLVFKVR